MGEGLAGAREHAWVLGGLCLLAGALLGAKLANLWAAARERARGHAQRVQGLRGERDAERLLRAHGYAIHARAATHSYAISIDGEREQAKVCFDFVVERDGERLVAEVKTGNSGPRVQRAETRRQLLEYQLATGARCVLLIDPIAERITEVAFPIGAHAPVAAPGAALWRAGIIAMGLVLGIVWWAHR